MVENANPSHEDVHIDTEQLPPVKRLSRAEAWELFDIEARRYFDMSGEEFIAAWEGGEFADDPDAPNVMWVAMMIPFVK